MNSPKFIAPVGMLLLFLCLIAGGAWFYINGGTPNTQFIQVTPIPIQEPLSQNTSNPATSAEVSVDTNQPVIENQIGDVTGIPTPHGIPTPLPASGNMARGESLGLMLDFDREWDVVPQNAIVAEEEIGSIYLSEFFGSEFNPWTGTPPTLSDKLLSLDGKKVELKGYMAPPLKLGLDWFLLGEAPIGACPFHPTIESITSGSALIYIEGTEFPFTNKPLGIVGELHVGELTDPETGMVSIARLYTEVDSIRTLSLTNP